jgi:hypothetical protein
VGVPGGALGARRIVVVIPRSVVTGRPVAAAGGAGWLWVENCIVDASILFSVKAENEFLKPAGGRLSRRSLVVVWWLSCQGRTVDALAPGADEGRGRPR